ncbi:O-acetyl-ADP-ribose deacetylase [Photobacterium sp. 1_MG-2023]|uniref:O-acetyl-ADP-ribose deacetylase n=1 Tax=Photobacterium sp. 1_MG-2023 TaxID=3062646 RepID=UPI0026E2DA3C|nr:O-acetyl-ADP-ribose deacetylase [Photobacterium sp. 1_MG-2023]MDO6704995.1 O-acetyl-ADP-ribose deacetylase [Photobacterium sp. 1_MG-2023]
MADLLVWQGDITTLSVDAIVNAANHTLLGGGGVDGAIHKAAGPQLLSACRRLNGCQTGEAKITPGYQLPAKWVIHTVGPIWQGGDHHEAQRLADCYRHSLMQAEEVGVRTIAFPGISTGVYGFPKQQAAEIAIATVRQFLEAQALPEKVYFVCFSDSETDIYQRLLKMN